MREIAAELLKKQEREKERQRERERKAAEKNTEEKENVEMFGRTFNIRIIHVLSCMNIYWVRSELF